MATSSLEERVAALEAKIQQIEQRPKIDVSSGASRGWRRIVGVFKDDPEFEEAVQAGREWRESFRP